MNIEEAKAEKRALVERLTSNLNAELEGFERKTGLFVTGFSVRVIDITSIEDEHKTIFVEDVQIEVDL